MRGVRPSISRRRVLRINPKRRHHNENESNGERNKRKRYIVRVASHDCAPIRLRFWSVQRLADFFWTIVRLPPLINDPSSDATKYLLTFDSMGRFTENYVGSDGEIREGRSRRDCYCDCSHRENTKRRS
jgi:hypothetical protein